MNYTAFELTFPAGVHLGDRLLADSKDTFCADTLFSALYVEALKMGKDTADKLLMYVSGGDLLWSDALPRKQGTLFLPKPFLPIEKKDTADPSSRKAVKSMRYIPVGSLSAYLEGNLPPDQVRSLDGFGKTEIRAVAAVRGIPEPMPYNIGVFHFGDQCGLNIILGYNNREHLAFFDILMKALSGSGIGGKRASGLGRFEYSMSEIRGSLIKRLTKPYPRYMSLSVCLPEDNILPSIMDGATYMLIRRSGFVFSDTYAPEARKKKDLYVFAAGSCFEHHFSGTVVDVSDSGTHPVYRYAKPLWLGVNA